MNKTMTNVHLSLSVCKVNNRTGRKIKLYEYISTFDEARLLSQLAMSNKHDDELVYILPGWNLGIKKFPDEYQKALELEEKYKVEDESQQHKVAYFTDQEYRLVLAALGREREVCEIVNKDCSEEHELLKLMNSIEKKIKHIQHCRRLE